MRVAVVAEYYPRPSNPALGVWAHRQALAVRDEGVDVGVVALDRPVPPLHAIKSLRPGAAGIGPLREWARGVREQPRRAALDGLEVRYERFLAPPRPVSYGSWGRWAARAVARALDELDAGAALDLVHAHYAVPAGDAALRWIRRHRPGVPLVVSVHGGDLTYAAPQSNSGWAAVSGTLRAANAVIVNSDVTRAGVEHLIGAHHRLVVVHPGADVLEAPRPLHPQPTLVTVANLEPHKSQADVIHALAALAPRHPSLQYVVIGKGPQRAELEDLAKSVGVAERVRFTGALPHPEALAELGRCHLHVMPSRHDGFGVAHIDAMGLGVPSIGGAGTGSEDIARVGEGLTLVASGDVEALVSTIEATIEDEQERRRLGEAGRETVRRHFSWKRNGESTAAVYRAAMSGR